MLLSPPGHKNQKWDFGDSLVSDLHPWAVLVEELGVQQAQVVLEVPPLPSHLCVLNIRIPGRHEGCWSG